MKLKAEIEIKAATILPDNPTAAFIAAILTTTGPNAIPPQEIRLEMPVTSAVMDSLSNTKVDAVKTKTDEAKI